MESFESVCKEWSASMKELVAHISNGEIPSLIHSEWRYEKRQTRVCEPDEKGKKKRCAVGERYYSSASLTAEDANAIWQRLQQFAEAHGLYEVERIENNEQELGRYDFRAKNPDTEDYISCCIYLPGEWNGPKISLSIFIGPRYRKIDLTE